jgi:hypothetical protein
VWDQFELAREERMSWMPTSGRVAGPLARLAKYAWAISLFACGGDSTGPTGGAALAGTVRQAATSAAVAGAEVRVLQRLVTTDAQGRFEVLGLPVGDLVVTVSADGFDADERTVSVRAGRNAHDVSMLTQTYFQFRLPASASAAAASSP